MRTGRHKTKLAKLLEKKISVSRGVLITLVGIMAVFGLMSLISYVVPSSRVMLAPLAVLLSFLSTIFLFFVGVNLSVPPQQFIDIFFFFAALPYWFGLALIISRIYYGIKRFSGGGKLS